MGAGEGFDDEKKAVAGATVQPFASRAPSILPSIVTPALFGEQRVTISQEALRLIQGRVQVAGGAIHLQADPIEERRQLSTAHARSRDFT